MTDTATVEIDLNVRLDKNQTFSGLDDVHGEIRPGQMVTVTVPETDLTGIGRIEVIDVERELVFLTVDWTSIS